MAMFNNQTQSLENWTIYSHRPVWVGSSIPLNSQYTYVFPNMGWSLKKKMKTSLATYNFSGLCLTQSSEIQGWSCLVSNGRNPFSFNRNTNPKTFRRYIFDSFSRWCLEFLSSFFPFFAGVEDQHLDFHWRNQLTNNVQSIPCSCYAAC